MNLTIARERHGYIFEKFLELSVICFIISYPFSIWWCNAAIVSICFFGMLTSTLKEKIEKFNSSPGLWWMVIYSLVVCAGMIYSSDKKSAFALTERSVSFFILPVFFGTTKFNLSVSKIMTVFALTTIAAAIYCVVLNILFFQHENIDFKYFFYWEFTYAHLTSFINLHPTYFSILILVSILGLTFHSTWSLGLRIFAIILLSFFQIMIGSKIGIILLFLILNILAVVFLLNYKRKRLLILYLLINLSVLTALYNTPVVYWRFRRAFESATAMSAEQGIDYRLLHWKCAQQVIKSSPLIGVGTGDTFNELNDCYRKLNKEELFGYNAHNQFLESWTETGIIGMIVLFLVLTTPYAKSIMGHNYFFGGVFLVFLIVSLVESIFQVQKGIALFCFFGALFQGHCLKRAK